MWYNTAALSVAAKSDRILTVTNFRLRKFKLFFLGCNSSVKFCRQSGKLGLNASLIRENSTFADNDTKADITDYSGATLISHFDEKRYAVKSIGVLTIRNGQPDPYSVVTPYSIDSP